MGCGSCVAKAVLLLANFVAFVVALSCLSVCVFTVINVFGNYAIKKQGFFVVVLVALFLLTVSILGCRTALARDSKRCARLTYVFLMLVALAVEAIGAAVTFNVGNVVELAQAKNIDISAGIDHATAGALQFLHDQVGNLYSDGTCEGGGATTSTLPVTFADVRCSNRQVDKIFAFILCGGTITTEKGLEQYKKCIHRPGYTPAGKEPSSATQAYCDAGNYIVSFASAHMRQIRWVPLIFFCFNLLLLIAALKMTCCNRDSRRVVRNEDDFQRAQLAQRMV